MSRVVVIGGGFAGVATACRLAAEGHRPLLLERSPRLGGRAASVFVPDRRETIDTGHHVLMRCCTASAGFLARIGASNAVHFQPSLAIPIASPTGRYVLRSAPLPGILHLAPALLRYPFLPFRDRARAVFAGAALCLGRPRSDTRFTRWLKGRGQSDRAIARLWDPICVAALNAPARDVGVLAARKVFRDAFFRPGGAAMGTFTVPLSRVFNAAGSYIEDREGVVRVRTAAERIAIEGGRVRGVELASGEMLDADAVVCAVPPQQLVRLMGNADTLTPVCEASNRLRWAPIVNLHAWFDRPILDGGFAVTVDSAVQAVFDVSRLHGRVERDATHVVISQSAAGEWIDRPVEEVANALLIALKELFPAADNATCLRTLVLRHRCATFISEPGSEELRPRAVTPIRGLFLAGDWTSTGWPSTIEGAIRSGIVAAAYTEELFAKRMEDTDSVDAP